MKIVIDLQNEYILNSVGIIFKGCNYEIIILKTQFDITQIINELNQLKLNYTISDTYSTDDEYIVYHSLFIPKIHINNYIYYARCKENNTCIINNDYKDMFYYHRKNIISDDNILSVNDVEILKINKTAVYSFHWGWTDYVILNSMVNYYNSIFDTVILLVQNHNPFLEVMFPNNKIYWCELSGPNQEIYSLLNELYLSNYLFLIDGHQNTHNVTQLLNTINLEGTNHIQKMNLYLLEQSAYNIGQYKNMSNTSKFIDNIKELDEKDNTFDERVFFYTFAYFDKEDIHKYFKIIRNNELEITAYNLHINNDIKNDYIVIHHNSDMKNIDTNRPTIYLNNSSKYILDQLKIIENAKEIHIFDSLYGTLIYLLCISSDFIKNIPIYYHRYSRTKIHKFYDIEKIRVMPNWIILDE